GVNFSADSQKIISVSQDGIIKQWNLAGEELNSFQTLRGSLTSVGFSPNRTQIALAYREGTVKLWNFNGEKVQTLQGHMSAVRDVSFSNDGQTLASSDASGQVILWNLERELSLDRLMQQGCNWVSDYLQTNPNVDREDYQFCQELI
ncbi:MAG: hypothetical protein SWJ54_23825, partial [Cyanobacteriota bacterium]|nr:hypothetical protein [Cyanobacteriota bacterium]